MKVQRSTDGTILNAAVLTVDDVARERVLCPICMEKTFDRWPEGWDAHAAYRCQGLNEGAPEVRKAAFRGALGHLFRKGGGRPSSP